ncbi:MAG: class I SAM-dependent rRNA methyltransferase [Anaerolineae bacterium]
MNKSKVILRPGKEKSLLSRHPWIFSGAILSLPSCDQGEILPVYSSDGRFLAQAYFHSSQSIAGRVLSFTDEPVFETIKKRLMAAFEMRSLLFDPAVTNAYRLINSEGDGLPGLVVDRYGDVLVIQINTVGMERLKSFIVDELRRLTQPIAMYEKSDSSARLQEGLPIIRELLEGVEKVEKKSVGILENGLQFYVSILQGQKTGFFLDQRQMRKQVETMSRDLRVLNCFSYSGGFSMYALRGGAKSVTSVDCCEKALQLAEKNTELNGFDRAHHHLFQEDVFDFLRKNPLPYDLVILDPPAFVKKRADIAAGCKGYKEINRTALEKMPPKSFLITSSCSYHVDENLFQQLIFQAALEAGRNVNILSRHQHAADHPVSVYHPEGNYLKSFILYVE